SQWAANGYKSDGLTSTAYNQVGNTRQSNLNVYWRTLASLPYSGLLGKQILGAAIVTSYITGTATTRTGGVYSGSCGGFNCLASYLGPLTVTNGTSWGNDGSNSALAAKYAEWLNQGYTSGNVYFVGDESATYTYKGFSAVIYF